jgi:phosphopantothenoylcysteine decarboxylase/phosphopantothenate--cysteine ligase
LVGFALETNNELENAFLKLKRKNLDMIVLNSLREEGAGFGYDTNKITILTRDEKTFSYPLKSKKDVAIDIIGLVLEYLKSSEN